MTIDLRAIVNRTAALSMKLLFGRVARIYVLRRENINHSGAFLLAANHISHFDPFIISSVVRRKIDWMAMAEFFPVPVLGHFLRGVDAFPADRHRANRKTIRTAIDRLKRGRIVGMFPEGGIRDGSLSLLQGAPVRAGTSTLAQMAGVPILPCVILGSDRLYARRSWLSLRRTTIWIAFGELIANSPNLEKFAARDEINRELADAFKKLYSELCDTFSLTPDDLPHSPQERFRTPRHVDTLKNGNMSRHSKLSRITATTADALMCGAMNLLQTRHRLHGRSREEMERYVERCEKMTPQEYYAVPSNGELEHKIDDREETIAWSSPIQTAFPANNVARADLFPSSSGWGVPTVFMLHSLMSASRIGYRRWAAHFNRLGWNVCFIHLPYHYSRKPPGYWNGELAITADLVRNAEGLRQAVMEVRQLMAALRKRGGSDFAILGTSYGGWVGALLAMVEREFRFVALMGPIVNVEHAVWQNPGTAAMSRKLRRAKIEPALVARHFHLSSPIHNDPLCRADRILLVAGEYDSIARTVDIEQLHQRWRGSELLRVRQGHFGYRMLQETVARLQKRGL